MANQPFSAKLLLLCALWLFLGQAPTVAQRKTDTQYFKTQQEEGQKLLAKGMAKQAAQTWIKAIRYADSTQTTNISVAEMCANVAQLYATQAAYSEAVAYQQRGLNQLETSTKHEGKQAAFAATLAQYYAEWGHLKESIAAYEKAIAWQLKTNTPEIISLYHRYAEVLAEANEISQELRCREAALRWAVHFHGENSREQMKCHTLLGNFYLKNHAYERAVSYFQKAIPHLKKEPKHLRHLIQTYANLGFAHHKMAANQKAIDILLMALNLVQKSPQNGSYLALIYQRLGSFYDATEDYSRALIYKKKALELYKKMPDAEIHLVELYNNIGNTYLLKNKAIEARGYQKKALKEALKIEDTLIATDVCNNLAVNYLESNIPDSAAIFINKGIFFLKAIRYTRGVELATLYASLADLHLRNKQIDAAQAANIAAIQANTSPTTYTLNRYFSLPLLIDLYHQQAVILEANNQAAQALSYIFRADSLAGAVNTALSEEDLLEVSTIAHKVRETGMRICYQMYQQNNNQAFIAQAFYLTERGKTQTLLKTMSESKRRTLAGIPDSLQRNEHLLKQHLGAIREVMAEVAAFASESTEYDSLQKQYDQIYARYEHWHETVLAQYPAYFQLKKEVVPIEIAQLQRQLKPAQHCIAYFAGDSTEYAIVIGAHQLQMQKLPSARQNLEMQVRNLRRTIMLAAYDDFELQSQQLHQRIWQPIAQFLPAATDSLTQVMIIPDGALLYLPFEALITAEKKYLLHQYNIAYHYSATLWQQTASRKQKNAPTYDHSLVAFAPVFDSPLQKWQPREVLRGNKKQQQPEKIAPLPASEMEVRSLDSLFKHYRQISSVFVKNNATENSIKSGILARSKFVHLATHGIVDDSNPDFSGLLFLRDSVSREDGKLYVSEIYALKINADLVVLSACESGLGKMVEGEGLIGLSRSFMYAGATNLSVSLWRVADEPTRILMTYFYQNILRQEQQGRAVCYSQALREAKRQLITQNVAYSFPYYWSPFVLVGDGRQDF